MNLQSRNQKPLERYFPELAGGLAQLAARQFVMDGEIVIEGQPFETLQLRLHPARSRIDKLAAEHPAAFIAFDLLVDADGTDLTRAAFAGRRDALEAMVQTAGMVSTLRISKATKSLKTAMRWLGAEGLDGIMAKDLDAPYRAGKRAMKKYKLWRTVDCVVAGLYRNDNSGLADSLLLGLHDDAGKLHYVGRIQVQGNAREFTQAVQPLAGGGGFTGRAPGGPSRWTGKQRHYEPLKPVLVAEVSADHVTGGQMRHGARFVRWRPDKRPRDCTLDQIEGWSSKPAPG